MSRPGSFKFHVTAEHIRRGKNNSDDHPIALALKDVGFKAVRMNGSDLAEVILPGGNDWTLVFVQKNMRAWLKRWLKGNAQPEWFVWYVGVIRGNTTNREATA